MYPHQRSSIESFDHDSLSERFRILILSKSKYFSEYSCALRDALNQSGVNAIQCSEITEGDRPHAVLVVGAHTVDSSELRSLRHKCVIAGIQTEQICSINQGSYQYAAYQLRRFESYAQYFDILFDWHRENTRSLSKLHPNIHYMPHGGLPEKFQEKSDDFQIAFLGNVNAASGRRARILKELKLKYSTYPKISDAWGDDKDLAFRSSQIVLNLHAEASLTFESPRFYDATSYGRLVISEPIFDSHPFEPGVHYVEAQLSEIVEAIDFHLHNCGERTRLEAAAKKIAQEYSILRSAKLMRNSIILQHYLLTNV